MALSYGPKLGLLINALTGEVHDVALRALLRALDQMPFLSVINRTTTAPPGSPANGDAYIVATGGSGAWSGHDKSVAVWTTDNPVTPSGLWEFYAPRAGWFVYSVADTAFYNYSGTAWLAFVGGGGTLVTSVAGRTGAVVLVEADIGSLVADLALKAPLASPALTGHPTGVTEATGDSSTRLASTALVDAKVTANAPGLAPVQSVAGRTGTVVLAEADIAGLVADLAALSSGVLAGTINPGYFISANMGLNAIYGLSLTPGTISTTNNQITGFHFSLPFAITINKISVNVVGAVSGKHANFGIYNAAGSKVLDSGAILCTTTGIKTVSQTATLPAGIYSFNQSADDSGVQVDALNLPGLSGLINVNVTRTFQAANPTVAGVMPASLGAKTPDAIGLAMAIALFQT